MFKDQTRFEMLVYLTGILSSRRPTIGGFKIGLPFIISLRFTDLLCFVAFLELSGFSHLLLQDVFAIVFYCSWFLHPGINKKVKIFSKNVGLI
jgi:hypothetical protein